MLQAILSRVHYNLTHPKTPMAIMPLIEEQFLEQRGKVGTQEQAWRMIGRLECPNCGKVYSAPTWILTGHCRECGAELVSRNVQAALREPE